MSGFSRYAWILLAATLLCLWPGRMALLDPDEARFAATAREMAAGGDRLVPHFDGEPRINKPPLLTWMQAAAFRVVGDGEVPARLPSLIAAVAMLLMVAGWARRHLDAGSAGPAAVALATTPIFFGCARLGTIDMLLALWVTGSVLLWHEAVEASRPAARRAAAAGAALCAGMAVLSKGPVGAALPAAIIGATALATRRRGLVTVRGIGIALAGMALTAGPWLAALASRIGMPALIALAQRELLTRTVSGLDHPRPLYHYALTFWPLFLPWSIAVPFLAVRAARARREGRVAAILPAAWLVTALVFFSLPADKNDAYLLPAAPALALLVAAHGRPRIVGWVAAATALSLVAAVWFASPVLSRDRSLRRLVQDAGLDRPGPATLIGYRCFAPSLVYYSGRRVVWARRGPELLALLDALPAGSEAVVVMTDRRYAAIREGRALPGLAGRLSPIGRQGGQEGYVALAARPAEIIPGRSGGSRGASAPPIAAGSSACRASWRDTPRPRSLPCPASGRSSAPPS